MDAYGMIEAYVADVAVQLPRKQRNDVAFELRALLKEELGAKAEAAGRPADEAMAIALLRAFGHPDEVAARYRPTLNIVAPSDGHAFMLACWIGLAVIWTAGLWSQLAQAQATGVELLTAIGRWWGATVIASLWWPGFLVASFATTAWIERRHPEQRREWQPRTPEQLPVNRAVLGLGLFGVLLGCFVLLDPRWILDFFWGGRAAPAAYQALTYTDELLAWKGPLLLALVFTNVPLLLAMIVQGRKSAQLRKLEAVLALATFGLMALVIAGGPVLLAPASDEMAKAIMSLIILFYALEFAWTYFRRVTPAPTATSS